MPEQMPDGSSQPTEKIVVSIPRLGIYGEGEAAVMETTIGGPGMDGEIIVDPTIKRAPLNIPRLSIIEVVEE